MPSAFRSPVEEAGHPNRSQIFWLVWIELYGVITLRRVLSLRGKWFTVLPRNGVFYGIVAGMNRLNVNRKAGTRLFFLVLCF